MKTKDIELRGDLLDEYQAIQAADEQEIVDIVQEIWDDLEDEYTEEDAFRDFIMEEKG